MGGFYLDTEMSGWTMEKIALCDSHVDMELRGKPRAEVYDLRIPALFLIKLFIEQISG